MGRELTSGTPILVTTTCHAASPPFILPPLVAEGKSTALPCWVLGTQQQYVAPCQSHQCWAMLEQSSSLFHGYANYVVAERLNTACWPCQPSPRSALGPAPLQNHLIFLAMAPLCNTGCPHLHSLMGSVPRLAACGGLPMTIELPLLGSRNTSIISYLHV